MNKGTRDLILIDFELGMERQTIFLYVNFLRYFDA